MRRVLLVSPHFPPDTTAGTHRARLLAPHLERYGWLPTIVSVDPRRYEGRLDAGLEALVPRRLRVLRAPAIPTRWARALGWGDLGLRALGGLLWTCASELARQEHDVLFITTYPTYPALLGPLLRRAFHLPFVLDYQDPWVGSWGATVGPGGRPDLRSRLSRRVAMRLEPLVLGRVDAVTAVSEGTYGEAFARYPWLSKPPCLELPIGGEEADFQALRRNAPPNRYFARKDGETHVCYVGTLLPKGVETLRSVLGAVRDLKASDPERYQGLHLHFFGTSNQTQLGAPPRVLPLAREFGVEDRVTELSHRIAYLEALTVLTQADAILLMGSSERHYTASKVYPALLARRPLLAVYHEASSVCEILGRCGRSPTVQLVRYGDTQRAEDKRGEVLAALLAVTDRCEYREQDVDLEHVREVSAEALAGRLAQLMDQLVLVWPAAGRGPNPRSEGVRA